MVVNLDISGFLYYNMKINAGVMELVDVVDSKSTARKGVPVRVRPPVPLRVFKWMPGVLFVISIGTRLGQLPERMYVCSFSSIYTFC